MKKKSTVFTGSEAGCSALSWAAQDGTCLWGRNYDFDRLADGSGITFIPRETSYFGVNGPEGGEFPCQSRYACAGVGLLLAPTPVLYDGVNERGLMGGQLYYREFASYEQNCRPGTQPLQPPFLVFHLLAQCGTVDEVVQCLEERLTLVNIPMMGTVAPLHWSFQDRTGETIVIEPDREGLHIYRNTLGVMTNSPGYSWHRLNLLNYAGIRDLDYPTVELEGETLEQCFSGSGAQGLPGDWSSTSRFVRLVFLKKFALPGKDEAEGVSRMFHLFQSAAFPLGMIQVSHKSHVTSLDKDVSPYDYTVYTSIYSAQSLRIYWTTYENQQIQFLDLNALLEKKEPGVFSLSRVPDFRNAAPDPF